MTIDELVGENVRRAREALDLSGRDLARRVTAFGLPLAEQRLELLEEGLERIDVDQLIAFGLALGMPPAFLLAPLNLGSLLCIDEEGRATASWSLFHSWARPFSPARREGISASGEESTQQAVDLSSANGSPAPLPASASELNGEQGRAPSPPDAEPTAKPPFPPPEPETNQVVSPGTASPEAETLPHSQKADPGAGQPDRPDSQQAAPSNFGWILDAIHNLQRPR